MNMKDVQELLPWYVNGRLAEAEKRAVEEYLVDHADAREDLEFLTTVRNTLQQRTVQSPGELGLKRLQRRIAQDRKATQKRHWWRPALAVAALVVVLVQGGLLVSLWRGAETTYQPAGGPSEIGAVIQVQFFEGATERQIREVVQSASGTIVSGPGALGIYRVRIEALPDEAEKIDAVVEKLRDYKNVVRHVSED